jgi:hypothetical protein
MSIYDEFAAVQASRGATKLARAVQLLEKLVAVCDGPQSDREKLARRVLDDCARTAARELPR